MRRMVSLLLVFVVLGMVTGSGLASPAWAANPLTNEELALLVGGSWAAYGCVLGTVGYVAAAVTLFTTPVGWAFAIGLVVAKADAIGTAVACASWING